MFSRNRHRVSLDCGSVEVTKQSHKQECDIHTILRQYQKTGIITHLSNVPAVYADLPAVADYQEALNTLNAAEAAFADLPSSIRESFHNDPERLLAALNDPAQADKLRELGVLKPLQGDVKTSATTLPGTSAEGAGA